MHLAKSSFASVSDDSRIESAEKKAEMSTLEARRSRKQQKIKEQEALLDEEGVVYGAGQF